MLQIATPERRWPHTWCAAFLDALASVGVVGYAADAAGIHRTVAYKFRWENKEFDEAWQAALDQASDMLIREARRRAHDGVAEPVIHQGKPSGVWVDDAGRVVAAETAGATLVPFTVRKYSDTLLIFLIKGQRPEYKDRHETNITNTNAVQVTAVQASEKDCEQILNGALARLGFAAGGANGETRDATDGRTVPPAGPDNETVGDDAGPVADTSSESAVDG